MKSYKESTPLAEAMVMPVDGRTLNGMTSQIQNLEASEETYELGQELRQHQEAISLCSIFHKGNWEQATIGNLENVVDEVEALLPCGDWKQEVVEKLLIRQASVLLGQQSYTHFVNKISPVGESALKLKDVFLTALQKDESAKVLFFSRTLWSKGILQMMADDDLSDDEVGKILTAVLEHVRSLDLIEVSAVVRECVQETENLAQFLQMLLLDAIGAEKEESILLSNKCYCCFNGFGFHCNLDFAGQSYDHDCFNF